MKTVKYNWDNEIYLIHVEVANKGKDNCLFRYSRAMGMAENQDEEERDIKPGERCRFIISKKSVKEAGVVFAFGHDIELKVFRLLDRAYLPVSSDMCKLESL